MNEQAKAAAAATASCNTQPNSVFLHLGHIFSSEFSCCSCTNSCVTIVAVRVDVFPFGCIIFAI